MMPSAAAATITLGRIADTLDAELRGDPALPIERLVHPAQAERSSDLAIAFEDSARLLLPQSKAGAALVDAGAALPTGRTEVRLLP